jgi:membrane-bound lytic murein transglycosylase B
MVVGIFLALSFALPRADATRSKAHAPRAKHVVAFDPTARENAIIAHIKHALGPYGTYIVTDPRFVIDPTMFRRPPGPPKPPTLHPRPKRYEYDYVFSIWSKERGQGFLEANKAAFDEEERRFGIPREVIDGVLDIETQWGKNTGKWPVVVRLYTLAVMRPDLVRPGWPEEQLIAFLGIAGDVGVDPFLIKGSSTGAFGLAQFEPTSYRALAVSCSSDVILPDLANDADAICSIGNYLHRAGWGTTEASHRRALFAYNRDSLYIGAILDYADWLSGIPPEHPRYQLFHPRGVELAATTK